MSLEELRRCDRRPLARCQEHRQRIREGGDRCGGGQREYPGHPDLASNAPPDALIRRVAPTPITDAVMTWVVEMGAAITKAVS